MNTAPLIEIYFDADDAQLPAFRRALREALLQVGLPPCWQEFYAGWDNVPKYVSSLSCPALLVNHSPAWKGGGKEYSMPDAAAITGLLQKPPRVKRRIRWLRILRTHASFLMAVLIAFFPKCPFCWAAYMSIFSFLGLNTISYKPWLLPVFIVLFFVNLASLYLSRRQHGYKLLLLSLAGAAIIVLNRLYWNIPLMVYLGVLLLMTASLWNSLSGRMANSLKMYVGEAARYVLRAARG